MKVDHVHNGQTDSGRLFAKLTAFLIASGLRRVALPANKPVPGLPYNTKLLSNLLVPQK